MQPSTDTTRVVAISATFRPADQRRHMPDRADEEIRFMAESVEFTTSVWGSVRRLNELTTGAAELRSIVPVGRIDDDLTRSVRTLEPRWPGRSSTRMRVLYRDDILKHPASMRVVRASMQAGTEVRTMRGPPTWLTIIGRSTVMIPRNITDPTIGTIFLHGGRYVETALWMFDHAWRSAAPIRGIDDRGARLTPWEYRVLARLATGAKDECAARELGVSPRTYRRHVTELCERLGASSRFEAGALAAQAGLI